MKRRATVRMSERLFRERLQFPESIKVLSARHDPWNDTFEILIEGDGLPPQYEGSEPARIDIDRFL